MTIQVPYKNQAAYLITSGFEGHSITQGVSVAVETTQDGVDHWYVNWFDAIAGYMRTIPAALEPQIDEEGSLQFVDDLGQDRLLQVATKDLWDQKIHKLFTKHPPIHSDEDVQKFLLSLSVYS